MRRRNRRHDSTQILGHKTAVLLNRRSRIRILRSRKWVLGKVSKPIRRIRRSAAVNIFVPARHPSDRVARPLSPRGRRRTHIHSTLNRNRKSA
jgi:hypothetical protein